MSDGIFLFFNLSTVKKNCQKLFFRPLIGQFVTLKGYITTSGFGVADRGGQDHFKILRVSTG